MVNNCSVHSPADFTVAFVEKGDANADVFGNASVDTRNASNPFVDYLFLMDAKFIVRSGSSFSGSVCSIKGLRCQQSTSVDLIARRVILCLPEVCDIY